MSKEIETKLPVGQPLLVRLLQCGRKSCGHVLTESERDWVRSKDFEGAKTAVCPECGNDDFYRLNSAGQAMTAREMRDGADREIDPATIEPSSRMGPKMKARILDAKRRALESLPNTTITRCPPVASIALA